MSLPGTSAITNIKVEIDDALVGISPLADAPVIIDPDDNEILLIAWDADASLATFIVIWNASTDATDYEIEISSDNSFPYEKTIFISSSFGEVFREIDVYDIFLNMNLFIRVRGTNGYSASPWSEVITFSVIKETLKEGLERIELPTNSGNITQYLQAVKDTTGKQNITVRGPMKLKVAVDGDGAPTELTTFLKNGDMWYDETGE